MAIGRWIWGNANLEDMGRQEFQIRLCDAGLQAHKDCLLKISNRLVSAAKRQGELTVRQCWFAGYLDSAETVYVIALAGEQNQLLGTRLQGSRGLFCVFALGFMGEDIRHYRQDADLFQPLKELMKKINETGRCDGGKASPALLLACQSYKDTLFEPVSVKTMKITHNIMQSTPETDGMLWRQSFRHPVMTGILSVDDAEKLLDIFPHGAVTVAEDIDVNYRYQGRSRKSRIQELREKQATEERKRRQADAEAVHMQAGEFKNPEEVMENVRKTIRFLKTEWKDNGECRKKVKSAIMLHKSGSGGSQNREHDAEILQACLLYCFKYGWPKDRSSQEKLIQTICAQLGTISK